MLRMTSIGKKCEKKQTFLICKIIVPTKTGFLVGKSFFFSLWGVTLAQNRRVFQGRFSVLFFHSTHDQVTLRRTVLGCEIQVTAPHGPHIKSKEIIEIDINEYECILNVLNLHMNL